MRIPFVQSIDKRIRDLPQPRNYVGRIIAVELPSRTLQVMVTGFGRVTASASAEIDFGTIMNPKVSRGMSVFIEHDSRTGEWIATRLDTANGCAPVTGSVVPNVTLPAYTPPRTTFPPFPPFPIGLPPFPRFSLPAFNLGISPAIAKGLPVPAKPQGRGNLLYVNTSGNGIARCVNAYSGTPSWDAINTGLAAGNPRFVYGINFDPFSLSGGKFTRMWAMTKDGLYLGTLTGTPSWTKKLDDTSASAVVGNTVTLSVGFTPNPRIANWIATTANGTVTGDTRCYVLVSTDNGTTWTGAMVWDDRVHQYDPYNDVLVQLLVSPFKANTYYIGANMGRYVTIEVLKSTSISSFTPHWKPNATSGYSNTMMFPFCSQGGRSLHANDNTIYMKIRSGAGTGSLRKYTTFNSDYLVYPPGHPAGTAIGPPLAAWPYSNSSPYHFYIYPFDENYILGSGVKTGDTPGGIANPIWITSSNGSAWTIRANTASRVGDSPSHCNWVLADKNIFYCVAGIVSGGGYAFISKTTNLGVTMTDISRYGYADGIDTVLGLTTTGIVFDFAHILVDYNKI